MCMFVCDFRDYIISYLRASGFKKTVLIKYYIRGVLATGYEIINFIKCLKVSRSPRARISDIKSRKTRIEHRSCKIKKA